VIDAGVDGLITNYPDRLRSILKERGFQLPRSYQEPSGHDCIAEADAS
jgi:glycerophosphoryl diester phosphodiesterase